MIETPRLLLRSPTQRDRAIMVATGSDAAAQRWLGWTPGEAVAEEHREDLLARRPGTGPMTGPSAWLDLIVIDKASGMAAGGASVELEEIPEIGGHLAPSFRRRGLGAELFAGVTEFAHQHLGIRAVRAGAESGNTGSIKSLQAAGFTPADGSLTHTLPDGRLILTFWFKHEVQRPGMCRCGEMTLREAPAPPTSRAAGGSSSPAPVAASSPVPLPGMPLAGAPLSGAPSPAVPVQGAPWPPAPFPGGTGYVIDPALDSPRLRDALSREADA